MESVFFCTQQWFWLQVLLELLIYHNGPFTPNFFYSRRRRLISHRPIKINVKKGSRMIKIPVNILSF